MSTAEYILVIDQGTTSSRVALFDQQAQLRAAAQAEFDQHYPRPGWVEHDAEQIWSGVCTLIEKVLQHAGVRSSLIRAVGITNQRETTVMWRRSSGAPLHRAIVWQDRRTADYCQAHRDQEEWLWRRTGLVLDPYFSATKMRWLLANVARDVPQDDVAFGTMDSYLIWKLTGGKRHVTDVTNASRTLLLNLQTAAWDEELCAFFGIPRSALPEVLPSAGEFGVTAGIAVLPDGIPICGVAGDQQASLFGQGCVEPGMAKCTYGTGAFLLLHTGTQPIWSEARLLTTLAATTGTTSEYALEGSLFIAGAAVQWLRDGLHIIRQAGDMDTLAAHASPHHSLVFVPALVGLGAPHWVPQVQGTLLGITRGVTAADVARATLEGVALQVHDLIAAIHRDFPTGVRSLRVDGGMSRSDLFLQLQADILNMPIDRVREAESTALGAALLAGWGVGWWHSREELQRVVQIERRFSPAMEPQRRERFVRRWQHAVQSLITLYTGENWS